MNITYSVTYTQWSAAHRAHVQNNIWISGARGQKLTLTGVQRILRRTHPAAIVVRRELWNRQ
jgi:hypothetical protein